MHGRKARGLQLRDLRFVFVFIALVPFGLAAAALLRIAAAPLPPGYASKWDYIARLVSPMPVFSCVQLFANLAMFLFICFVGFALLRARAPIPKRRLTLACVLEGVILFLQHPQVLGVYTWQPFVPVGLFSDGAFAQLVWGFLQPQLLLTALVAFLTFFRRL